MSPRVFVVLAGCGGRGGGANSPASKHTAMWLMPFDGTQPDFSPNRLAPARRTSALRVDGDGLQLVLQLSRDGTGDVVRRNRRTRLPADQRTR